MKKYINETEITLFYLLFITPLNLKKNRKLNIYNSKLL